MREILKYIRLIFYAIFPFVDSAIANKKIDKSLKNIDSKEIGDSLESLREEYERSLKGKDKLEDKAKTNIVAVTISITLIMGATSVVNGLIKNPVWFLLPTLAVILFIGSVIYMIVAGTSAFKLLMDKNVVYYVSHNIEDEKQEYFENKEKNNKYNLIRNNLINTSFRCIRNALICLFIVLTLTLVNQFDFSRDEMGTIPTQYEKIEIYYSNAVFQTSNLSELRLPTEALILEYYDLDKLKTGEPTGLIDTQNKLFVKVIRQSDEVIYVISIEPYIP